MAGFPFDDKCNHQCDIFSDDAHGGNNSYLNCQINPGHKNFLRVSEFGMKHLPRRYRTKDGMKRIQNEVNRTVNIIVSFTSANRPDTFQGNDNPYPFCEHRGSNAWRRCGTGYIEEYFNCSSKSKLCPCLICKNSKYPKTTYHCFVVSTATHVVYDKSEATRAVLELFYDSDNNKDGVEYLYGVDVFGDELKRWQTDSCNVMCVTHNSDLAIRLRDLCDYYKTRITSFIFAWPPTMGLLISHPHGTSKRISIGCVAHRFIVKRPDDAQLKLKKGVLFLPPSDSRDRQNSDFGSFDDNFPPNDYLTSEKRVNVNPEMNKPINSKENDYFNKLHYDEDIFERINDHYYGGGLCLRCNTTVVSPPDADFVVESNIVGKTGIFYKFPPRTKLVTEDGRSVYPPLKFVCSIFELIQESCLSFLSYDMASCPGSSGARIIFPFFNKPMYIKRDFNHFGCRKGTNISGLRLPHDVIDPF